MMRTAAIGLILTAVSPLLGDDSALRFNRSIRPILSEYCFSCHGPDGASRKGDLRLDMPEGALESGAVVPGKPEQSEIISRIFSSDPETLMPPPSTGKKLSLEQRKLLTQWIKQGAKWEGHWAFLPPKRARVPVTDQSNKWANNAIDHFVHQGLAELRLKPNEPADRYILARRAALDLTGLPPEKQWVSEFVNDRMPGAFGRYVERLLSSYHAGEHRARFWLDAARYGDTHGMHVDNYREVWPYRDWVVRAFNNNMPFDQFVVEQLAGDLLPNATLDQRIATGFSRCNITTAEGGAIPEELNVRYMVDRVETTATVFLGLTAGCAVCHDHKYDPIRQREFYQLGAFFNNTTQPAMDGNQKDTPPVVALPAESFLNEWHSIRDRRNRLTSELASIKPDLKTWWESRKRPHDVRLISDDLLLHFPMVEGEGKKIELPKSAKWATTHPAGRRGILFGKGGKLDAEIAEIKSGDPLSISFWFRTPDIVAGLTIFDHTTKTKDKKTVGWKLTANTQGGLSFEMHDGKGADIRALLPGDEALKPRSWQHVCVRYSGGQSNSSVNILVNGRNGRLRNSTEKLIAAHAFPKTTLKIGTNLQTAAISDLRIYRRWLDDQSVKSLANDYRLLPLLNSTKKYDELSEDDLKLVEPYYVANVNRETRNRIRDLAKTELRRDYIYSRSTTTLVMQERATEPAAYVLQRGEYDQRLERVASGIPKVLNFPGTPLYGRSEKQAANRLDLAKWLVHRDHPLTARVMVNRLWQSIFGMGIVKTSEDFGVMGSPPTHPELLDWLSVEFIESGWDVNHLLTLIVTSATYQQSSRITVDRLAKDPENRNLSRGPRVRLDAEVIRDQALAVSGLLHRQIGGPAVKPYQPAGLWNVVAITGSNTRNFKKDSGSALYRRSLYTFWKRTSPPPSMAAFNAPTREQCTVRRERTNTPLQALVLMNDPQFVEAARALAEKALGASVKPRERAEWMLERVLSRPADTADVNDLTSAVEQFTKVFAGDQKMARALITTGDSTPDKSLDISELAAWTMAANTLMNRDDFVTK